MVKAATVTNGRVTIPKRLREKYCIKDKIIFEEGEHGIVLKPLPSPSDEMDSLKGIFKGKTARQLLDEARKEEAAEDQERERRNS